MCANGLLILQDHNIQYIYTSAGDLKRNSAHLSTVEQQQQDHLYHVYVYGSVV